MQPSPLRATYLAYLILVDFITRTILGEEYRSLSSSLCIFFPHSSVTSSLLGPLIVAAVTETVPVEMQKPSSYCSTVLCSPSFFSRCFVFFLIVFVILFYPSTLASIISTFLSLFFPSLPCLSLVGYPLPFRFIFYLSLLRFRITSSPFFPYFLPLLLHVLIPNLASVLSTFRSLLPCICSSLLPYSRTNKFVTS